MESEEGSNPRPGPGTRVSPMTLRSYIRPRLYHWIDTAKDIPTTLIIIVCFALPLAIILTPFILYLSIKAWFEEKPVIETVKAAMLPSDHIR